MTAPLEIASELRAGLLADPSFLETTAGRSLCDRIAHHILQYGEETIAAAMDLLDGDARARVNRVVGQCTGKGRDLGEMPTPVPTSEEQAEARRTRARDYAEACRRDRTAAVSATWIEQLAIAKLDDPAQWVLYKEVIPQGIAVEVKKAVEDRGRALRRARAEEARVRQETAAETERAGRGLPTRYPIEITTDELSCNEKAIAILAAHCKELLQRGNILVEIVDGEIRSVELPRLRELISHHITWVAPDPSLPGFMLEQHPPDWATRAVAVRGTWEGIRPLLTVVSSPVLLPNGKILADPGYDEESKLFFAPPKDALFEQVADNPSQADAASALEELFEVFADFPFEEPSGAHRSAVVALLLTLVARYAIAGPVPCWAIDATVRAAGKGKVVQAVGIIATGAELDTSDEPRDDAELSKVMLAIAMQGARVAFFDNIARPFGCSTLDAVLTSERNWGGRELGKSRWVSAPWRAVIVATGNNLQLRGDTARRAVHVRLKPRVEHPDQRTDFRHRNLLQWIKLNRPALLRSALTILRAFTAAGRPKQDLSEWGSYDAWSDLVRGALVYAGAADPAANRTSFVDLADSDMRRFRGLAQAWHDFCAAEGSVPEGAEWRAYCEAHDIQAEEQTRVRAATIQSAIKALQARPDAYPALREVFEGICAGGPLAATRISGSFRHYRERLITIEIGGGNESATAPVKKMMQLVPFSGKGHTSVWALLGSDSPSPSPSTFDACVEDVL